MGGAQCRGGKTVGRGTNKPSCNAGKYHERGRKGGGGVGDKGKRKGGEGKGGRGGTREESRRQTQRGERGGGGEDGRAERGGGGPRCMAKSFTPARLRGGVEGK